LFGVLAIGLLPLLSAAAPASVRLATTPASSSGWLDRLNQWRASTGTSTLSENAGYSAGDVLHATYMVKTGDVRHGELTSYPAYYTPAGDVAGQNSNIFVSSSTGTTDVRSIDWWMAAPFHAMGMMDPRLTSTGFGSYRDTSASPWQMGAALNVGQGMGSPGSYPVFFPGNGSTEPLTNYSGNESPDPTLACPGYSGLPLFVEVGGYVDTRAGPHTLTGNGTPLTHCVIDSSDSRYAGLLKWRGAVLVFPQAPLQAGVTYVVNLTVNTIPYAWTFTVGPIGTLCGGTPNVTSVAPASGPGGGGTSVTINGCGFTGATLVKFGASPAIGLTVVSDTQVTALSPAHAAGPVDVTVTTAKGTSPTGSADLFTYSAPPGPPISPTAAPGNLSATVAWSPPASDGGSALTSYTATSSPGGLTTTVGGSATSAVVPGLTLGTSYTFTVVATNVNGSSAASAPTNPVTAITVASAPTTVTATAANASAVLSWNAPSSNGGGAITGYVVTPYIGGVAGTPVTFSQTNLMEVVTGLTNGVIYTFTVRAVNAAGSGAVSGQTSGITPSTVLRQPSAQGAVSTPAPRTAPVQSSSAPPPPAR